MTKTLVFISPVAPKPTGSGRSMRAYQLVKRYAAEYSLIVITNDPGDPAQEVAALAERYFKLKPPNGVRALLLRAFSRLPLSLQNRLWPTRPPYPKCGALRLPMDAHLAIQDADVVLVFRIYMMPVLAQVPSPDRKPILWLDLDDWESRCHERIARLARGERGSPSRRHYQALAEAFRKAEKLWLPQVAKVFVCSEQDRENLSSEYSLANVEVFANRHCGPIIEMEQRACPADAAILFIGSMGYLPNQDAVRWFCQDILPGIKARFTGRVLFHIVGGGMPTAMRLRLQAEASVIMHGYLGDLLDIYRQADVVVCPIRTGGGTRIKVLEAIAHHRAVVATPLGIEGLDFNSDHLAIAEDAQQFRDSVLSLLAAPEKRRRQCRDAALRLQQKYWLPPAAKEPASSHLVTPAADGL